MTRVGPKTDKHATEAPPTPGGPIAAVCDRESGNGGRCGEPRLAANACGFGSAGFVDERRLFEAELVALTKDPREANAKAEQRRVLTTSLSTNEQCPEGPNA